jgi:hypothetical protein
MDPSRTAASTALVVAVSTALAGCAALADGPRPASSSAGCARAAVDAVVTPEMTDVRKHCVGAAAIARACSVAEAWLASYGKEVADALGDGDAEARDLRADRAGIACARSTPDAAGIDACCARAGH